MTAGKIIVDMWFKMLDQLFDASDPFPPSKKELTDRPRRQYMHRSSI
jgi:hypothetical protein